MALAPGGNSRPSHFGDVLEEPGGCLLEQAQAFARGLALAHLDAVLRDREEARWFLADGVERALTEQGIDAYAVIR